MADATADVVVNAAKENNTVVGESQRKDTVASDLRYTFNIVRQRNLMNNRRWQIICQHSRDITQKSKAVIGILHENFSNYINGRRLNSNKIMKFCERELHNLQRNHFKFLFLVCNEMTLRQARHFHRAMSPGIEEFIEAVGFYKMVKYQDVLNFQDVKDLFTFVRRADAVVPADRFDATLEGSQMKIRVGRLLVTYADYVGGVSDFIGELMRVCVRASSEAEKEFFLRVLTFTQSFHTGLLAIPNHSKKVQGKISAIKMNVMKLELHAVKLTLNPSGGPSNEQVMLTPS